MESHSDDRVEKILGNIGIAMESSKRIAIWPISRDNTEVQEIVGIFFRFELSR